MEITEIIEDFKKNVLATNNKDELQGQMEEISKWAKDFFDANNMQPYQSKIPMLSNVADKLKDVENNKKKMEENVMYGIFFGVNCAHDKFLRFLSCYNIGRVSDFYLRDKSFYVTLRTTVNNRTFCDKASAKKKFELQKQTLKHEGIEIIDVPDIGYYLSATDENRKKISDLLDSIGGKVKDCIIHKYKGIEFIKEINLILSFDKFLTAKIGELTVQYKKDTELLNPDEKQTIFTDLSDMKNAIDMASLQTSYMTGPIGPIIASCIYDICTILGMKTEVSEKYYESIKNSRLASIQTQKIQKEMGEKSFQNLLKAKEALDKILEQWKMLYMDLEVRRANATIKVLPNAIYMPTEGNKFFNEKGLTEINGEKFLTLLQPYFSDVSVHKVEDVCYCRETQKAYAKKLFLSFSKLN